MVGFSYVAVLLLCEATNLLTTPRSSLYSSEQRTKIQTFFPHRLILDLEWYVSRSKPGTGLVIDWTDKTSFLRNCYVSCDTIFTKYHCCLFIHLIFFFISKKLIWSNLHQGLIVEYEETNCTHWLGAAVSVTWRYCDVIGTVTIHWVFM